MTRIRATAHRLSGVAGIILILGAYGLLAHQEGSTKQQQRTINQQQLVINAEQRQLNAVVASVAASQVSQLANRTRNVYTWCSAINATRDYVRLVLVRYHIVSTLVDLDCPVLAAGTMASAHP